MGSSPPHWRRFDRIEVEVVWAAVMVLDIADKLTILRELATEVAAAGLKRGNEYDKVRAAVISLRDAADLLGRSPSQYEYRQLAKENPEFGLVPDATLRRWLGNGSWDDCLRRAMLDAVSDGDFTTLAEGDRFTEQELVDAIRMYMGEHEGRVPVWAHFVAWARSPEVRARPGRRPSSNGPFQRLGGYREVLARSRLIGATDTRFDIRGRALPSKWKFTDEELREAVLGVARELGRPPREVEYRRARELARDRGVVLPSVSVLTNRFGGRWSSVLEAAGLDPGENANRSQRRTGHETTAYTRDELLQAVKWAWTELGEPFTKPAYARWRKAKLAEPSDMEPAVRIPAVETICREFGGWPEAVGQALPPEVRRRLRRKTYE